MDGRGAGLERYILGDQPATCGICGARTEFDELSDGIQIHQCLNSDCLYKFVGEFDEELSGSR